MNDTIKHIKFENRKHPKASFDLLQLEEVFNRPNLDHDPLDLHLVEFFLIVIVTKGNGKHYIDFNEYPLKQGTILTIRKDQIHRFIELDGSGYLMLFKEDFLMDYLEKQEAIKTIQLFNDLLGHPKLQLSVGEFSEITSLVAEIRKEYTQKKDEYSLQIIRSFLQVLISKLYRFKSQQQELPNQKKYLNQFIQFQQLVEAECFQNRQVQFYARKLGVSAKTLNNIVHSILHKPAKRFIDEIVIVQIKRLIINSDLSIKEIAYRAGFQEPSNLFKYFKKYTGQTPEEFRKTHH